MKKFLTALRLVIAGVACSGEVIKEWKSRFYQQGKGEETLVVIQSTWDGNVYMVMVGDNKGGVPLALVCGDEAKCINIGQTLYTMVNTELLDASSLKAFLYDYGITFTLLKVDGEYLYLTLPDGD